MRNMVLIVVGLFLFGGLGGISNRAYAQQEEQTQQEQIDERDASKRDFAAHGEIDYSNGSLYSAGRVYTHKENYFPFPFGIDYDPYTKKAVYCANIGKDGVKLELFIVDANLEGNKMAINELSKKRITWDSVPNQILNVDPFWTKDRKIIFCVADMVKKQKLEYMINIDGSNKKKITPDEWARLHIEAHNEKTGMVDVPPSN